MTAMEALRRNVVFRRAKSRISQSDLAERANVARQTISKIESGSGDVTVSVLEKIARVLECSIEQLFDTGSAHTDERALGRRAKSSSSEYVNARELLDAIDEANAARYSRAGRPKKVDRKTSP